MLVTELWGEKGLGEKQRTRIEARMKHVKPDVDTWSQDEFGRATISERELGVERYKADKESALKKHQGDPRKRLDFSNYPKNQEKRKFFMNFDFQKSYPKQVEALRKKKWLFLSGVCGSGKTMLACGLGWKFLERDVVRTSTFLSISDWMRALTNFSSSEEVDLPRLGEFVILDDFDKFRDTDFQQKQIFRLIDFLDRGAQRYIVITSNQTLDQLRKRRKDENFDLLATLDRMEGNSEFFEMNGVSHRTI